MAQNQSEDGTPTGNAPVSNNSSSGGGSSSSNVESTAKHNSDDLVEALTAAMPPSMSSQRSKTADEILAEMNRIPLFMTTLDETDGEGGENVMLEAIKALAYEGSKAEVAANFREQGNEAARGKLWKDAREFYTKAIASVQGKVKLSEAPKDDDFAGAAGADAVPTTSTRILDVTNVEEDQVTPVDEEAEAKKEHEIEEACLANRALCNLEMKNYGQVNKDCASVLRLNPRNIKAWYRAATACLALDKIPEAEDACLSGLEYDPTNTSLSVLQSKIHSRKTHLRNLHAEREKREARLHREKITLNAALKARNISLLRDHETGEVSSSSTSPPELEDAAIHLSDPQDPTSTLSFPVLFLYPLHAQTDFVKEFQEHETLGDHLAYLLPLPWDAKHEYSPSPSNPSSPSSSSPSASTAAIHSQVDCYMETSPSGLIKAGKKLPLIKLLAGSGKGKQVEIGDGLVRVFVVPRARAEEWIGGWKVRKGRV